jgi:hypothetical protein
MKFVAFDQRAAEEIASDRFLQSTEFEPGRALGTLLTGRIKKIVLGPKLGIELREEGIFLLGDSADNDNLFVIDEAAACLLRGRGEDECLLILQKLCRFAIRHWKRLRLSRSELIIANSTKAVVFPFPISNQTSYRIVIEREPDKQRMERRSAAAYLLAYRAGTTEGDGPNEEAPLTEFRRAIKALPGARAAVTASSLAASNSVVSSLRVTALDGNPPSLLPPQQGFDRWMGLLTEKQRIFVADPLTAPHRIEGPAGTGKTLCLILKAINELRNATERNAEHRALFVAHSEATRKTIQELLDANDPDDFSHRDRYTSKQSLKVTTLHVLCSELLNTEISETEFLDRDAMESKNVQLLYVTEALKEVLEKDFETHRPFLSHEFAQAVQSEDEWTLSEMLQHEISVVIKGRAEEDLDKYRRLPLLKYGLPLTSEADRGFAFVIFKAYQDKLKASAQFDTDDIVLTAIGQLNTPIWRRRRQREGYDSLYLDETHLFNMNELSVFHYLIRSDSVHPIAYSVDRSQSLGDRGWSDESFSNAFSPTQADAEIRTVIRSVFRCAPEIVNLAFAVTSSGATLFTNFDDPLKVAASAFTDQEERKSAVPTYSSYVNDQEMVAAAFSHAERLTREMGCSRHELLIVAFDPHLMDQLARVATEMHKPVEVITQRGDSEVVKRAERGGRFVLGLADYVGGLEFDGVVLVGVDHGRVPPARSQSSAESSNFLSYSAHSRLYVAITRAKYRVEALGVKDRGPSRLLGPAFANNALVAEQPQ